MKWISVKDMLPEKNCDVFIFLNGDVYKASFFEYMGSFYMGSNYSVDPTHWMHSPPPPTKETDCDFKRRTTQRV